MTNPAAAAQLAQKMTAQDLARAAQGQHPQVPPYIAASELMRRQDLQRRAAGMNAMAGQAQDKSVLEDLLDGQQINPQGIGSLPAMGGPSLGQQQAQTQQQQQVPGMPQVPGMQALPVTTPPDGRKSYAAGGLVAFDDGGSVYTGPRNRLGQPLTIDPAYTDIGGKAMGWLRQHFWDAPGAAMPPADERALKLMPPGVDPVAAAGIGSLPSDAAMESEYGPWPTDMETQVQQATPNASSQGIRAPFFSPQPVTPAELPSFLQNISEPKSLSEYKAERESLMPPGLAYAGLEGESGKLGEEIASRRSENVGEALLQAGAAMAASRSPYFAQAVGEGAISGLGAFREGRKEVDQLSRLKVQYDATIEGARRQEAIGNLDAAEKMRTQAEALREKALGLQSLFTIHDLTSQRSLQGQLAQANATALRATTDKELAHEDKIAAQERAVFMGAYQSAKDALKDDPTAMMMPETAKEEIALRRANTALEAFRRTQVKGGGLGSLTIPQPSGKLRGRLDSSGNLVQ